LDTRKPDTTAPVLASIAVAQIDRLARDELLAVDRVVAKELEEGSEVREGAVLGGAGVNVHGCCVLALGGFEHFVEGGRRDLPPGIPRQACWHLPIRDSKALNSMCPERRAVLMVSRSEATFLGGSWMVHSKPLKIQPKISLTVSQMPSPSVISFLSEMGSSPSCPVAVGGGNT
jgi:hypothetical protein